MMFSPDSQTLISASQDKTIKRWDLNNMTVLQTFSDHDAPVNSVAVSADGNQLVSGSWDKIVKVWRSF